MDDNDRKIWYHRPDDKNPAAVAEMVHSQRRSKLRGVGDMYVSWCERLCDDLCDGAHLAALLRFM